jgi:hypothetical protein
VTPLQRYGAATLRTLLWFDPFRATALRRYGAATLRNLLWFDPFLKSNDPFLRSNPWRVSVAIGGVPTMLSIAISDLREQSRSAKNLPKLDN